MINSNRPTSKHIIIKMAKIKYKEKMLKAVKKKVINEDIGAQPP